MKRHPALRPLSDDHHTALVLGRRLRRFEAGTGPESLAALARDVARAFRAELEPHFRVEERWLLPALAEAGASQLARRVADEHATLRELVSGSWTHETAATLGALLEKHVRFEERVVFPEAEALLSAATLDGVHRAALDGKRGSGS